LARGAQDGRTHDTADVTKHRLAVFTETTRPLIRCYQHRGILVTVNAGQPPDSVTADIEGRLSRFSLAHRGT